MFKLLDDTGIGSKLLLDSFHEVHQYNVSAKKEPQSHQVYLSYSAFVGLSPQLYVREQKSFLQAPSTFFQSSHYI